MLDSGRRGAAQAKRPADPDATDAVAVDRRIQVDDRDEARGEPPVGGDVGEKGEHGPGAGGHEPGGR